MRKLVVSVLPVAAPVGTESVSVRPFTVMLLELLLCLNVRLARFSLLVASELSVTFRTSVEVLLVDVQAMVPVPELLEKFLLAPKLRLPLTVVVPPAAPIETVVAAPPMFKVVAVVLKTLAVVAEEAAMVAAVAPVKFKAALAPPRFKAVALVKVTVGLRIEAVPPLAPMFTAVVAAPNKLPVKALVLKTDAVPVEVVAIAGLAPLMFRVVRLAKVTVGLLMVAVPVEAPMLNVVAAPPMFKVVALALNRAAVVPVVVRAVLVPLLMAMLPAVASEPVKLAVLLMV